MLKSYFPPRFNTLAFFVLFLLWLFNLKKILIVTAVVYFILFILLRRGKNDFREDSTSSRGVIFSPVNGRVVHIEHNISHATIGEQYTEIQIMLPVWKEMGIYLPYSCEIRDLHILKGDSFWRRKKMDEALGTNEGKGISLTLDNKEGSIVGLSFLKCKFGLWPEIMVMPGDRGGRRVNIGFFPFGGTVVLYLPKKYEILVKENDEMIAQNTIVAMNPDQN